MKLKGVMRYYVLMIFVTIVVTFAALFTCKLFGLLCFAFVFVSVFYTAFPYDIASGSDTRDFIKDFP